MQSVKLIIHFHFVLNFKFSGFLCRNSCLQWDTCRTSPCPEPDEFNT
jgi:hypothetical protein